jgi:hypothetical protein
MQTLHLRFRALRAISLRQGLSRWRTPSDAMRAGMGAAFALPNPPEPTCAVGWRPAKRHPDGILCPVAGAGLPGVSRLRAARNDSRVPVFPYRVCRWQTATELPPYPAPHEAGDLGATHWQARASEGGRASRRLSGGQSRSVTAPQSDGLSFPLRPARCGRAPRSHRAPRFDARDTGEKTVAQRPDGSGTRCSEAPGFRPTGSLDHHLLRKRNGRDPNASCADAPALVTGQEPVGMGMPGVAHRSCRCGCLCLCRGGR